MKTTQSNWAGWGKYVRDVFGVGSDVLVEEVAEDDLVELVGVGVGVHQEISNFLNCCPSGIVAWVAIDTGGDCREGDGTEVVLEGEGQALAVASTQ